MHLYFFFFSAASQPATTTTTTTAHYSAQPAYPIQTFPTGAYPPQQFQQQYPQPTQFTQEHFQYPPPNTGYPPPQPPYPPAGGGYQGAYPPPPPGNPPPYPINDQPPYNPSFQWFGESHNKNVPWQKSILFRCQVQLLTTIDNFLFWQRCITPTLIRNSKNGDDSNTFEKNFNYYFFIIFCANCFFGGGRGENMFLCERNL